MNHEHEPHSADVLTDWRDDWWSLDFLQLIARRLRLEQVRSAVDVGCGKGHWSRVVLRFLHPEARLIGVDREAQWVREASESSASDRLEFVQGTAEALPLPDASVELVTCQTVLMHVASAERALAEMLRVLRPGGLLLLSEPANFTNNLMRDSVTATYTPARLGRIAELQATLGAGRVSLGEGDESVGDRLPALLAALGVQEVQVVQNERMNAIHPPHTPTMREAMGPYPELVRERRWRYDRSEALRLYSAGGGDPARFELLYGEFVDQAEETVGQLEEGRYWSAMGHNHYLVSGRKS